MAKARSIYFVHGSLDVMVARGEMWNVECIYADLLLSLMLVIVYSFESAMDSFS
jgi:hypothetical protein